MRGELFPLGEGEADDVSEAPSVCNETQDLAALDKVLMAIGDDMWALLAVMWFGYGIRAPVFCAVRTISDVVWSITA